MEAEVVQPKRIWNTFYHVAGLKILFLNKIRHTITGYRRPRPFSVSDVDRAVDYDLDVIDRLEGVLRHYTKKRNPWEKKVVLELGPGADLGNAVITRHRGAKRYLALDVNRLAPFAPDVLYEELIKRLKAKKGLLAEVHDAFDEQGEAIQYQVSKAFDPQVYKKEGVNLVISNAAFEHFDDVNETIARLSKTVKKGTIFIADIDLQTHTRWIREADPLNIYRFSSFTWRMWKFLGSPNRVRPHKFERIMQKHGWKDVKMYPRIVLSKAYTGEVRDSLNKRFRNDKYLPWLDFYLVATKK